MQCRVVVILFDIDMHMAAMQQM